jgi:hypothetical protein
LFSQRPVFRHFLKEHHLADIDAHFAASRASAPRRRALFGAIRKELGVVFHRLAERKECRIEEGHVVACSVMLGGVLQRS